MYRPIRLRSWPLFLLFAAFLAGSNIPCDAVETPLVILLPVEGVIGPATSDYLHRGFQKAQDRHATAIILYMDTPGGLDLAMRKIIQDIIASPIPVVTYVAPSGARAASAGTYILYASHIAAMAPGTNLGAATPIQLGATLKSKGSADDTLAHKQINDASAYIRGLAQLRGRNTNWAEQAVRSAVSLSANEALKQNVIDIIANSVDDLLRQADGRTVNVTGHITTLHTTGARVERVVPDWRTRILSIIADPNVAYILMLLGIYGLFFELWNPGYVLPGVVGGISLLLALFAFQVLPINYTGLGLIILGLAFMVAEAFLPTFGALGVGGVVAFIMGSMMLLNTDVTGFGISWSLIALLAFVSLAFFITVITLVIKTRRRPVTTGQEQLLDSIGEALTDIASSGWVRVCSENWQAQAPTPIARGQKVRIVSITGLTLTVAPLSTTTAANK